MRIAIFLLLSFFTILSYASCELETASIKTETLFLSIYDEGCANDKIVIYFATKDRESREFENSTTVPFVEECTFKGHVDYPTPSYIICRKNGRTPLAGATYKLTQYKKSKSAPRRECEPDDQAGIGVRYICIKGCEKPMVPKYLEAFDGMC